MKEQNKKSKVAAIKYDIHEQAPTVIAKGIGGTADRILEQAKDLDIPVYKDEDLVETLTKLELGDYIPPELYQVVAEIMVFVTDVDKMFDK